jgi:transposase-like protein
MDFPITELLDREESINWIIEYFHKGELRCPRCGASVSEAREFRTTQKSQLTVYRCSHCHQTYNLYSHTVFEQRHIPPEKVILLLRGVLKGEPSIVLARELELHYTTVLELRRDLQDNAYQLQPDTPLEDERTETDEMFQNAGEKRRRTLRSRGPAAPPGQQATRTRYIRQ